MREDRFNQFAKTAHSLPINQKRQLLAMLNNMNNGDLVERESNDEQYHFALFGNHSLAGVRRIY